MSITLAIQGGGSEVAPMKKPRLSEFGKHNPIIYVKNQYYGTFGKRIAQKIEK